MSVKKKHRWRQAVTYLDVQSRWGLVCRWVADQHHFEAIGELQPSVNPFVLGRANDVIHHHLHGWVGHFERQGWRQPAAKGESGFFCLFRSLSCPACCSFRPVGQSVLSVCFVRQHHAWQAVAAIRQFDLHVLYLPLSECNSNVYWTVHYFLSCAGTSPAVTATSVDTLNQYAAGITPFCSHVLQPEN